jgi:hypothetical protein
VKIVISEKRSYYQNEWPLTHVEGKKVHQSDAQLVLCFADPNLLRDGNCEAGLEALYPEADIITISTSGEILGDNASEGGAVAIALQFETSQLEVQVVKVKDGSESYQAGALLMASLCKKELPAGILLFSDGSIVNGGALLAGIASLNTERIPIMGGLAGDGKRFEQTLIGVNGKAQENCCNRAIWYAPYFRVGNWWWLG